MNDNTGSHDQDGDKTFPLGDRPGSAPASPEEKTRILEATILLQQLGARGEEAEGLRDVRTIDFLRAADDIVRPFGFEIVRLIGKGGMGAVFEGRDLKLDRPVAIKFILPERREMFDLMAKMLESEARALASINHENAVRIYTIHRRGDNLFIVMEFVRGKSLAQYVAENGPLPEAQALRITIQTARALAALHKKGIIHRDIKPENILLAEDGEAKLSDFGLALARDKAAAGILSSAAGTPAYMSPEVFEGEKPSVRSDIYSLGMTLRFMLTGKRPHLGDSWEEIRHTVTRGRLPGLRAERADISAETELIVAMALKRSPDRRYQTAEALAAACEKALLHLGQVREKPPTPPARVLLRSSGRTWAFILLILLIGGLAGWWTRGAVRRGRSAFKMWSHQTANSISNAALGVLAKKRDLPLVPVEIATQTSAGVPVRIVGTVSAAHLLDPRRHQFIVQDETGGILIDDPDGIGQINTDLVPGDKVELVGAVRLWQGYRVVEPSEWIERLGRSRPPKPVPLALERIGPDWLGWRVRIDGLRPAEGPSGSSPAVFVTDGKGHRIQLLQPEGAAKDIPHDTFDLVAIVLGREAVGGRPGQISNILLLPLEIRPASAEGNLPKPAGLQVPER